MKQSLEDYTEVMRGRYVRRTGRQARSLLLDEYCQTTGLERKHALKVLRGQRRNGGGAGDFCCMRSPSSCTPLQVKGDVDHFPFRVFFAPRLRL